MLNSSFSLGLIGPVSACGTDGAIIPAVIPIPNVEPDELAEAAGRLRAVGEAIEQSSGDITSAWAALSGIYVAPESDTLLSVVDPVRTDGTSVQEAVTGAADALDTFVEEGRSLKAELISLKEEAEAFRAEILGNDEWVDDDDLRAQNNSLNNRVAEAVHEYQLAERRCANKIGESYGGTYFLGSIPSLPSGPPGEGSDGRDVEYYGTFTAQVDAENPWGAPAEPNTHWTVDAWDGFAGVVVGAAAGVGAATGHYRDGEAVPYLLDQQVWGNMGHNFGQWLDGLGSLAGIRVDGRLTWPDSLEEWHSNYRGPWIEVGESVLPLSQWDERPAYVISTGATNAASMLIGVGLIKTGYGAVGAVNGGGPDASLDGGAPDLTPGSGNHVPGGPRLEGALDISGMTRGVPDDLSLSPDGLGSQQLGEMNDALGDLNNAGHGPSMDGGGSTPGSESTPSPVDTTDTSPSPNGTPASENSPSAPADGDASTPSPNPIAQDLNNGTPNNGGDSNSPWTANPVHDPNSPTNETPDGVDNSSTTPVAAVTDNTSNGANSSGGDSSTNTTTGGDASGPAALTGADSGGGSGSDGGDGRGTDSSDDQGQGQGQDQGDGSGQGTGPTDSSGTGGNSGGGSTDGGGATTTPTPALPPDPTAYYPGHLDSDGIRRFNGDAEVDLYAQQVLNDPNVNPHAFDNLPPYQQSAVHGYTMNSWLNAVGRADSPADAQRILDGWTDHANNNIMNNPGWSLYELNGRTTPTMIDLLEAQRRGGLSRIQRTLISDIIRAPNSEVRLNEWLRRSGLPGSIARANGGTYPTASDGYHRMSEVDPAVERPLPEGVEAVRGLHSLNHLEGFDPNDLKSLEGTTHTEQGYMSTSLGRTPTTVDGKEFHYILNLDIPQGSQGLWLGTNSAYPNQRELVLPRSTEYRITEVREVGGKIIIQATVIPSWWRQR